MEKGNATAPLYAPAGWDSGLGMGLPDTEARNRARISPRHLLGRFRRETKGAAAVEFALLAFPFFLLLFGILEGCISFAAQELMTNATDDIARQFRTGQLRPTDIDENELHNMLCERMRLIFPSDCPGLKIDLRTFDTFQEGARIFDEPYPPAEFKYQPGAALSKNTLRVFYHWPVITDLIRERMSNLPDHKALLFASHTWQNEPFDD